MTVGSNGYDYRRDRAGTPGWPGGLSYRARRDIYGRINPWIAAIALVVIAVAGGVIPTLVLHSFTGHPKKAPVYSSTTTKTSTAKKTHSGHVHGAAKLSVTLSASPAQLDVYPIISGYLGGRGGGGGTARYEITASNNGNAPLMDTVLRVSAIPLGGGEPFYSPYNRGGIYCPESFLVSGPMACYVGSKVGYMAPATSEALAINASYSGLPSAPASLTLRVSVSGIAPDGKVVTATASPVSVRVIPVNYSTPLHIQLSFQPDPVSKNQWFDLIVTLTNESTTSSIRYVAVQVPVTPQGDPGLPPKGFPDYSYCTGVSSTWGECLLNPYSQRASMLAPGASRTLYFAEIVPGPGYPASSDVNLTPPQLFTQQDPGEVQASGMLSSGGVVYATATGYVNIS